MIFGALYYEIRAERKAGEMLADTIERGGDRLTKAKSHGATLLDLGIY